MINISVENCNYCIYKITNKINNKIYIGITTKEIDRWKKHLNVAKSPGTNKSSYSYIHKAINKYGEENFTFEIFDYFESKEDMIAAEIYWISKYKEAGVKVYNLTNGGDGVFGYKYSEKQLKAKSDCMKGKFDNCKNPFYGKNHTAESKSKISKNRLENKNNLNYFGENCSQSVLTENNVINIINEYNAGENTLKLAEKYNVTHSNINKILDGKTWINIQNRPIVIKRSKKEAIQLSYNKKGGKLLIINKICPICNASFEDNKRENNKTGGARKFCSIKCRMLSLNSKN